MARGKTLLKLLDDLRAECRLSLNPAHNSQVRDTHIMHLQRVQEWLWDDFNWPHLRVERTIPCQAGERIYEPPAELSIDRLERVQFRDGDTWLDLCAGIGAEQYNIWDSELDQRSWPIERWRIWEDQQIEVWPIAVDNADPVSLNGYLKFIGIRDLSPLVNDGDRADLDDRLIVLYAASEILAAAGAKDAQLKLNQANKRYAKIRGELTPRRSFRMFGNQAPRKHLRGPPRVYYRVGP